MNEILEAISQLRIITENLIKVGIVKTYFPERHTAVVELKDNDEITTEELPILTPFTYLDKAFFPLNEGQKVLVIFLPEGENTDGFIIGAFFDEENPPPVQNKDKFHIVFEDGTSFEYDKSNHKLNIHSVGDIEIISDTHITLKAPRIDLNP